MRPGQCEADQRHAKAADLRLAFAAEPKEKELSAAVAFLTGQAETFKTRGTKGDPREPALTSFCQALLSANAFLYLD